MVRIAPLPHKRISKELNDDLRNKLTSIGVVLEYLEKAKSDHAKRALNDLDYIEKKLEKFELRNSLPIIRNVLNDLFQLKHPSKDSIEKATEDFKFIKKVLDDLPAPSFPLK